MMTKYLNVALILALVAVAGVMKHYTPPETQRVAAQMRAAVAMGDQLPL
jgi:hypothetical protein